MARTFNPTAPATFPATRSARFGLLAALNWLVERDRAYRDAVKLRRLPQERLDDIGLSRQGARSEFLGRHGNRPADRAPVTIKSGW